MRKSKPPLSANKTEVSIVRSSAAEYLTFVAATGGGNASVEMRYEDENLWLTQKMMATLYDVSVPAISQHLKRIYADNELTREATVKQYLMVQTEGGREVQRTVDHYSLQAIIAVGFKIENERAVQFRKWANQIVKDYTIQGWVMDVERLKSGGSVLTEEFFERQLEKIREIRLSERKFYQKITDIYATALDYDATASATKRFFAAVQNKLHYAIHGQTAAEVIVDRADHRKDNMGLTHWEGAPHGKIYKYDVTVAKNYLSEFELGRFALGSDVLKPYKTTIDRWLWPDIFRNQDTSVSKAKKAISDYKKAIGQPEGLAELMVFYCERASGFSNDVGLQDEGYFDALVRMFEQALKVIHSLPEDARPDLLDRLDAVRHTCYNFGYGVGDDMDDLFAEHGIS